MTLFGYEYDKLLLNAQVSTFPKLILLDKDISKKVINNSITITILHHESDKYKALEIKQMIDDKFHHNLGSYKLVIMLKSFDSSMDYDSSNAYYILKGDLQKVRQLCQLAKKRKILTFSYEIEYLKQDVLFSLALYNKIQIYINKKEHNEYNISFATVLYQIIRFFR